MSGQDPARRPVRRLANGEVLSQAIRRPVQVLGPPLFLASCSPYLTSVVVHFNGERRVPCLMHRAGEACPGCAYGWQAIPEHWLMTVRHPWDCLPPLPLRLTQYAIDKCPQLVERAGVLTCCVLCVWREPRQSNGRMKCRVMRNMRAASVPDAEDTLEVLHRLWSAELRRLRFPPAPKKEGEV